MKNPPHAYLPVLHFQTEYQCDPGFVFVSVVSATIFFLEPKGMECAELGGPYQEDRRDCETVTITSPAAFQSPVGAL